MAMTRTKALLVDDFHTHRQLTADFLEDAGYEVKAFGCLEDIRDEVRECEIMIMDVHLGNDKPFGGIDYVIEQIQTGVINPFQMTIIFKTMWSRDVLPEDRLGKIQRYDWWDGSEGLEFTELRTILRRRTTS